MKRIAKIGRATFGLLSLSLALSAAEVVLTPSAIIRLGGTSPEDYKSGLMNEGKGTVGSNGEGTTFKCLVGFDLVTVVEDLEKLEEGELTLTFSFNKDPETTPVWMVYLAGVTPNLELKNEDSWELFTKLEGNVGEFPENVKAGDTKSFSVTTLLTPETVSPVKRYVWFRIEEAVPKGKGVNTIAGFSTNKEDNKLVLTFNQLP